MTATENMETQTTTNYALPQYESEKLPSIVYVGYFSDIAQPTQKEGSLYLNARCKLKGIAGSRDFTSNFTFRPEWFSPTFNIKVFKDAEDNVGNNIGKSLTFVYHNNLVGTKTSKRLTTLAALAGSPENYATLWSQLLAAQVAKGSDLTGTEVVALVSHFVKEVANEPKIGYIISQQREKNEDGSTSLTENYQVSSFFYLDENGDVPTWVASQIKSGKAIYGFER